MLRHVFHISKHCQKQLWKGGYPLHQMPIYVVDIGASSSDQPKGRRGFLINHPAPPKGAKKLSKAEAFGLEKVWSYDKQASQLEAPGFQFQLKINNVSTFAIGYGESEGVRPRASEFLALLVHEGFHKVQLLKGTWRHHHSTISTTNYPFRKGDIALSLLENRVLRAALKGGDADLALKTFYVLRHKRLLQAGSKKSFLLRHDNEQERIEGTALYIEHKMLRLMGYKIPPRDLNSSSSRLQLVPYYQKHRDVSYIRQGLLARFYATGAVTGALLDKLKDTTWQQACQQGKSLYEHLHRRYGKLSTKQRKALLQKAKKQYGFEKLVQIAADVTKRMRPKLAAAH